AHNTLMPKIIDKVKEKGADDVVYILGGIIPQQDIPNLMAIGVNGVFGPGTPLDEVTDFTFEQVAMIKAEKLVEDMGENLTAKNSNF
ncbi:MAG: methylmalonyl-CoA mutase, partial [Synergistaceae bacterium]